MSRFFYRGSSGCLVFERPTRGGASVPNRTKVMANPEALPTAADTESVIFGLNSGERTLLILSRRALRNCPNTLRSIESDGFAGQRQLLCQDKLVAYAQRRLTVRPLPSSPTRGSSEESKWFISESVARYIRSRGTFRVKAKYPEPSLADTGSLVQKQGACPRPSPYDSSLNSPPRNSFGQQSRPCRSLPRHPRLYRRIAPQ
jgi:hypothetical protein